MNLSSGLFMATFALVFYVVGASFIEAFVNYRTWPFIGESSFQRYHQAVSPRILAFVVVPYLASFMMTCSLLWARPSAIPSWCVWLSLAFNSIVALVSAVSQIPIQREFDRSGWSALQLEKLNRREWFRKVPIIANGFLFVWMMAQMLATLPVGSGQL